MSGSFHLYLFLVSFLGFFSFCLFYPILIFLFLFNLFYYYPLGAYLFSNERQKGGDPDEKGAGENLGVEGI